MGDSRHVSELWLLDATLHTDTLDNTACNNMEFIRKRYIMRKVPEQKTPYNK